MNEGNDIILIRGLEVKTCHGVHAEEKVNPQPFIFDADLYTDFYTAAKSDDLNATVNYSKACEILVKTATEKTYNLIETVAYSGVYALLDALNLKKVRLTVYKPNAPIKRKFDTVGVTVTAEKERVFLSLGSSMGDRKSYLDKAQELLSQTRGIKVKKVSSYIETEPYGGVAQNGFLNCAVEIETYLTPHMLLEEIHRIENECGRVRTLRWGDRTLDIDIIFFGHKIIEEDDLQIPHREYFKRSFVLAPLNEIAPDFVCPVLHKKVKELQI
ncbi:MAG: 2-amino-4-hydroxy-6-hydroxymethyldihydropteridine diphosphokinase [Clostridia bacterium]|nr:2-amino-4-hydroxy-6-hydroxymethyldihydropteridine diphosphokinase [Clostridia bacterium]